MQREKHYKLTELKNTRPLAMRVRWSFQLLPVTFKLKNSFFAKNDAYNVVINGSNALLLKIYGKLIKVRYKIADQ